MANQLEAIATATATNGADLLMGTSIAESTGSATTILPGDSTLPFGAGSPEASGRESARECVANRRASVPRPLPRAAVGDRTALQFAGTAPIRAPRPPK